MVRYLKSDEYYIDQYDRFTIETLKAYEAELIGKFGSSNDEIKILSANTALQERAIAMARTKYAAVAEWKNNDILKDNLAARYRSPKSPHCDCGSVMEFKYHDFPESAGLHFIFGCETCSSKTLVLDHRGERVLPRIRYCSYCNGRLMGASKRHKGKIIATDTCVDCGRQETIELEIPAAKKIEPIDDRERLIYCTQFENSRGLFEDLKMFADLQEEIGNSPDLTKIEILKIPKLEHRLSEMLEKSEFTKLNFQQPKISEVVTVMFSVEDISDRDAARAAKELKKLIEAELLRTNWRLMSTEIISRMGYLSGQLKGFDNPEHLHKLIREIGESGK